MLVLFAALLGVGANDCACFSLCHPEEVRHFLFRLPRVESEASPWHAYLRRVYNTDSVPLPVDLRELGAFQLPGAGQFGQLQIPWARRRCQGPGGRSSAPACAHDVCARWLNLTAERQREIAEWESTPLPKHAVVLPKIDVTWHDGSLPISGFSSASVPREFAASHGVPVSSAAGSHVPIRVLLDGQVSPVGHKGVHLEPFHLYFWPANTSLRVPHRSNEWVEAGRFFYRGSPEGVLYGCWYTPLLEPFPRGTGVFVGGKRLVSFAVKGLGKRWAAKLGARRAAPVPGTQGLLSEAVWASSAAEVWAEVAARQAQLPACNASHGERSTACAIVDPVAAAAWAASAAAEAAERLRRLAHSGEGGELMVGASSSAIAAAAAAARSAAAAAARAKAFELPDGDPRKATSNVDPAWRNHCSPWTNKAPQDLVALARAALPGGNLKALSWLEGYGDNVLAACTREMGFDAIEMLQGASNRPEFVDAGPHCTWPGQASPPDECGAPETELRTGWHAELPCACRSGAQHACRTQEGGIVGRAESRHILNCGRAPLCEFEDSPLPLGAARKAARVARAPPAARARHG